jgi:hypothetical protein
VTGCAIVPRTQEAANLAVLDPNEPNTAQGAYISGPQSKRNRSWEFAPHAQVATSG